MLEQAGIHLKGLNIDKLKAEYQELTAQKKELTATYKNCDKELKSLRKQIAFFTALQLIKKYRPRQNGRYSQYDHSP